MRAQIPSAGSCSGASTSKAQLMALAANLGFDSRLAQQRLSQAFDEWKLLGSDMTPVNPKEQKVLRLLANEKQKGQVTPRDVVRHHVVQPTKKAKALLDRMHQAGLLDYEQRTTSHGGRASHLYRVAKK
jgi:hypothetical protein